MTDMSLHKNNYRCSPAFWVEFSLVFLLLCLLLALLFQSLQSLLLSHSYQIYIVLCLRSFVAKVFEMLTMPGLAINRGAASLQSLGTTTIYL